MNQVNYLQVVCGCGDLSEPYLEEEPYTLSTAGHDENGDYFSEEFKGVFRNWRCKRCGELIIEPEDRK